MSREAKFRVWDKKEERMIVHRQDFFPLMITNFGVMKMNPHCAGAHWELVDEDKDRFEITEFTGLYDKHGKEIFEGDIIDVTLSEFHHNDWSGRYKVVFVTGGFYLEQLDGMSGVPIFHEMQILEIVGNIFEK